MNINKLREIIKEVIEEDSGFAIKETLSSKEWNKLKDKLKNNGYDIKLIDTNIEKIYQIFDSNGLYVGSYNPKTKVLASRYKL